MTPAPTPPTEKVLLKYPDGRTEEHETETLTFKETTDKGWESRYKDLFLEIYRPAGMGDESDIDPRLLAFIQHIAKEEYERGRKDVIEHIRSAKDQYMVPATLARLEAALETPS